MIDSLDSAESHCLDQGDLETLFKANGEWQTLCVQRLRPEDSVSQFLAGARSADSAPLRVWLLGKLAGLRKITNLVHAMLNSSDLCLFTYIQAELQVDGPDDLLVVWCHADRGGVD